jgi:diadenosine tetraphosphate (Ap4A) HIT family hydrolase
MISSASPSGWSLHPRLASDAATIGDLTLSQVLAMRDANYPWALLVPRVVGAVEIIDLSETQRAQLMAEITLVAAALKDITQCDKLNVAAIGNVVSQLHIHVVARRYSDAAWPGPVWGAVPARPYGEGQLESFIATLRQTVGIG